MNSVAAFLSMIAFGAAIAAQGWWALVWFPLGWLYALFGISNMVLLPLMGLPMAGRLKRLGMLRPEGGLPAAVVRATLACIAFFGLPVVAVLLIWPSLAKAALTNQALWFGLVVGTLAILCAPFSAKQRKDFELDFYKRFEKYMRPVSELVSPELLQKIEERAASN